MSYLPGRREIEREALRSRKVEADLVTRNYEHTHPQAEYGLPKRPSLLRRLLRRLGGRRTGE